MCDREQFNCIFVDIDGFAGCPPLKPGEHKRKQVLVPREIGMVDLSFLSRKICYRTSLYFRGSLSESFIKANYQGVKYQQRRIHGYSTNTLTANGKSMIFDLPEDPREAAKEGEEVASTRISCLIFAHDDARGNSQSRFALVHKGGDEGKWLEPLAQQLSKLRAGSVVTANLDNLHCPKMDELLSDRSCESTVESMCNCGPATHSKLIRGRQRWARHCPQAECLAMACWAAKNCYYDNGILARYYTVDAKGVIDLVEGDFTKYAPPPRSSWEMVRHEPKEFKKCYNYIKDTLMRRREYAPEEEIRTALQCISTSVIYGRLLSDRTDKSLP
jgi:hypothetical protein